MVESGKVLAWLEMYSPKKYRASLAQLSTPCQLLRGCLFSLISKQVHEMHRLPPLRMTRAFSRDSSRANNNKPVRDTSSKCRLLWF